MNPYQRASPRTASPASNLQTNPTRTNNPRHSADRNSYFDNPPYNDRGSEDGEDDMASRGDHMAETDQRQYQKINQVIQNFFTKSALSIVSSRVILPTSFNKNGDIRQNKWFNVILDDSDELQLRLTEWKTMDAMAGQHPPLYIEVYLDISGLGHKQSLVVHDEDGKRWDVAAALNAAQPTSRASSRPARPTQLVIERWKIYVGDIDSVHPSDLTEPLPNVYKKAVVLFRGLYANLRLLPAFKYNKSMAKQPANHTSLKLNYRILNGASERPQLDTLSLPLCPSTDPVTETAHIGSTNSPIGPLCISVEYRDACEFSVEDSESLLSDQFMGLDDTYLEQKPRAAAPVPGSLPVDKLNTQETPDVGQAYGSLSTFHQVGPPTGTSPISALRAARDMPSSSPIETPPQKLPPNHRTAQGSKSSLRSNDTSSFQRRTSVSFQPFKAGSLSSSPAPGPAGPASPSSSLGRPTSAFGRNINIVPNSLNQPRNRTSLNALPQAALRAPSLPNDNAIASSASSSPKPAPITRYSSSFGHRRGKFSTGGSKTEEDALSSGKGSATSSLQRGSDTLNDGEGGSSGEMRSEDDNISDFLKLLEAKKDLKSFNRSDSSTRDATMRKTTAQLGKYQRMRDSHAQLSDSVSSSTMLHRSSSSSSRQLSSVPAMIHGTSISTASSPGKPISPHTPHTPAIPSRLSANSIIEYDQPHRSRNHRSRSRSGRTARGQGPENLEEQSEVEDDAAGIDIPLSPRPWNYQRRSSSVAQQNRNLPEDEPDMFGVRAASLPVEEGDRARDLHRITSTDLTSSGLFAQTESLASASRDNQAPDDGDSRDDLPRASSTSNTPAKRGTYSSNLRGRGGFFSQGSSTTGSTGGTSSTERQSRYNFNSRAVNLDDDEPLLFQMSEIGAGGSRRSLEEARGGSSTGSARGRNSPWGGR
ncbi:autophagy-related protein [Parastagonospora nodorum]|nr:autophagy-related protein [Parastagonospora nodorum]KAH4055082.1 autophagy-related protein [Parastagonospora nodorum]KAH4195115.1 autophagy-related protein [Parastagonospora nodorum]KAH4418778.1 autophagy-related protein [Parastagonospora nodorum]KAH4442305.1 autophagy-related protein [Parastagonospora nodorum]